MQILFTGPECTGKTTLSRWLADHLNAAWVEEYARGYLYDARYTWVDVTYIASRQRDLTCYHLARDAAVHDTSLLVMHIWMLERFGRSQLSDADVIRILACMDRIYLCYPDVPYKNDGWRSDLDDRARLFERYSSWMNKNDLPFMLLEGSVEDRKELVLQSLM